MRQTDEPGTGSGNRAGDDSYPRLGQARAGTIAAATNMAVMWRVIEEIWNQGELDLADDLFTADYINHAGPIEYLVRGPEAIKMYVALYRAAFPSVHITVDDVNAHGDTVVLSWTARRARAATATRSTPAGNQDHVAGLTRSRLVDGKIVESWTCRTN